MCGVRRVADASSPAAARAPPPPDTPFPQSRPTSPPRRPSPLQALGLTWRRAVPCLFNFLYVPSPEALAPFRARGLLDALLVGGAG